MLTVTEEDFVQLTETVHLPAYERVVIRVGICGHKLPSPIDASTQIL